MFAKYFIHDLKLEQIGLGIHVFFSRVLTNYVDLLHLCEELVWFWLR